jgi:hypothetical protein
MKMLPGAASAQKCHGRRSTAFLWLLGLLTAGMPAIYLAGAVPPTDEPPAKIVVNTALASVSAPTDISGQTSENGRAEDNDPVIFLTEPGQPYVPQDSEKERDRQDVPVIFGSLIMPGSDTVSSTDRDGPPVTTEFTVKGQMVNIWGNAVNFSKDDHATVLVNGEHPVPVREDGTFEMTLRGGGNALYFRSSKWRALASPGVDGKDGETVIVELYVVPDDNFRHHPANLYHLGQAEYRRVIAETTTKVRSTKQSTAVEPSPRNAP